MNSFLINVASCKLNCDLCLHRFVSYVFLSVTVIDGDRPNAIMQNVPDRSTCDHARCFFVNAAIFINGFIAAEVFL